MGYNLATEKSPNLRKIQDWEILLTPYTSLLHKEIYDIPFILLIGWRVNQVYLMNST